MVKLTTQYKELHVQAVTQKLRITFKAVQAHSKNIEKKYGLSGAQLWMLAEVSAIPGIRVSPLAKVLSVHASTCSNMLDKLEAKELIYRNRSKQDQRTVHLYITESGQDCLLLSTPFNNCHLRMWKIYPASSLKWVISIQFG